MKRKYPFSLFFWGVISNMLRYGLLCLLSIVLVVVGAFVHPVALYVGLGLFAGYILLCIIEQLYIRHICLKKSEDEEFNKLMDILLSGEIPEGEEGEDEENPITHRTIFLDEDSSFSDNVYLPHDEKKAEEKDFEDIFPFDDK